MNKLVNSNSFVIFILFVSFLIKMSLLHFIPQELAETYKWEIFNQNYHENLSYSYFFKNSGLIEFSNYTPLLFPIIMYPLTQISQILFILFQILCSVIASYLLFLVTKKIFNKKIALIFLFIFCFFPLNIYYSIQFTSINLFIFLFSFYLLILLDLLKKNINLINIFFFNLLSVLCILTRFEFVLIYLFTIFYLIFVDILKIKKIILSFLIIFTLTSPLMLRNLHIHGNLIFIGNNLGINFWTGWYEPNVSNRKNTYSIQNDGTSSLLSSEVNEKILKLPTDNWETNLNNIYYKEAINNIKKNIINIPILFIKRIFSQTFWFIDHDYPRANNLLFTITWLFIILNFLQYSFRNFKKVFSKKEKHIEKIIYVYLFYYLVFFSSFLVIPSCRLFLLPLVSILASENIYYLYKKFNF